MKVVQFKVSSLQNGMRLLAFLRENYPSASSVKAIKRSIESRLCKVNGQVECFSSKILAAGDVVELCLSEISDKKLAKISIIFEDQDFLICDKPAGIVSDAVQFNRLLPAFKGVLQLVHRLDKDTSGVILVAKNEAIKKKLMALFTERTIHKTYLAIVDGPVKKGEGSIENFLAKKFGYQGQSIWGSVSKTKGQLAVTKWRCLNKTKQASLILCEPETGRTHQLRVHFSEIGHPILGDYQYAKEFICPLNPSRHLLHAFKIKFNHPLTKKIIKAEAAVPKDFKQALKALGLDTRLGL